MMKFFRSRGLNDRLYMLNFICVWTFVIMCYILTVFSSILNITDMSIINSGVPCAFGELSIHTGFIVWKAKQENFHKFQKKGLEVLKDE